MNRTSRHVRAGVFISMITKTDETTGLTTFRRILHPCSIHKTKANDRCASMCVRSMNVDPDTVRCARIDLVSLLHERRLNQFNEDDDCNALLLLACTILFTHVKNCIVCKKKKREPTRKEFRRLTVQEVVSWFRPGEFRRAFRMELNTFNAGMMRGDAA